MQNINGVIYDGISVLYTRISNKELKERSYTVEVFCIALTYPLKTVGLERL